MRSPHIHAAAAALAVLLLSPAALAGDGVWTSTFPYGGDIQAGGLVVSPADPQTLYALPWVRGLFSSRDGAVTWQKAPADSVWRFGPAHWVAAGGEAERVYTLAATEGPDWPTELFRSEDGGRELALLSADLPAPVTALAVDPGTPDRLVVGLQGGDIHESTDGGETWRRLGTPGFTPEVLRVFFDPHAADVLYASIAPRGLFRSRDRGATWSPLGQDSDMAAVMDLRVDPRDPGVLYAVDHDPTPHPECGDSQERLFQSTDGGVTWSRWDSECTISPAIRAPGRRIGFTTSGEVYVALMLDLWKGSPGEPGWRRLVVGEDFEVKSVAVAEQEGGAVVYVGTSAGVYASSDGGDSWRSASTGIRAMGRLAHGLAYDASDPEIVYYGGWRGGRSRGGYRSLDGGVTWELTEWRGRGADRFATHPGAPGLVYAASHGLFRSSDYGRTWTWLTAADGCLCGFFADVMIDPGDPRVLYFAASRYPADRDGVYRSTDGGDTWTFLGGRQLGEGVGLATNPAHPGVLYAGGMQIERPLRLHDDRFEIVVRWSTDRNVGYGEPEPLSRTAGYFWFFAHDNIELVAKVLDGCRVNDRFWIFLAGLTNVGVRVRVADRWTGWSWEHQTALGEAFAPVQDTAALAGCEAVPSEWDPPGVVSSVPLTTLHLSRDSGKTWRRIGEGLPESPGYEGILDIVVHPLDPNVVLVAARDVLRSTDGGITWRTILRHSNATTVAVDPTDPEVVYAGEFGNQPLYRSTDGGETWEVFNEGLPPRSGVLGLAVDPQDPRHLLAASIAGVWEIHLPPPTTHSPSGSSTARVSRGP